MAVNKLYIVGSLRNPEIPKLGNFLRKALPDFEVFDDWYAAGPDADDRWKEYEQSRGNDYYNALMGYSAEHVFGFDKKHLDEATHVVMCLPAGRSAHMELGYAVGKGKHTAILFPKDGVDPDRWDVMALFGGTFARTPNELLEWIDATGS